MCSHFLNNDIHGAKVYLKRYFLNCDTFIMNILICHIMGHCYNNTFNAFWFLQCNPSASGNSSHGWQMVKEGLVGNRRSSVSLLNGLIFFTDLFLEQLKYGSEVSNRRFRTSLLHCFRENILE